MVCNSKSCQLVFTFDHHVTDFASVFELCQWTSFDNIETSFDLSGCLISEIDGLSEPAHLLEEDSSGEACVC